LERPTDGSVDTFKNCVNTYHPSTVIFRRSTDFILPETWHTQPLNEVAYFKEKKKTTTTTKKKKKNQNKNNKKNKKKIILIRQNNSDRALQSAAWAAKKIKRSMYTVQ